MIVLLESVHPDADALLERSEDVHLSGDPLAVDAAVARRGVRAILTRGRGQITAAMLDEFPDLVVVGRCGAGLDNIDVNAAGERGIAVVNAPGATTAAVSEHALLLMLGIARRVAVLDAAVKAGRWSVRDGYTGSELRGKHLGVVGLGAIGRRVAELGQVLDMDVSYWSPRSRDDRFTRRELDDVLTPRPTSCRCASLSVPTPTISSTPAGCGYCPMVRWSSIRHAALSSTTKPSWMRCSPAGSPVTPPMCGTPSRRQPTSSPVSADVC